MKIQDLYDKSKWEKGPWTIEPDYVSFIDFDTFYPCVAKRNIIGAWVAYVGLDEMHPLYMMDCTAVEYDFVEVHNEGPTYTDFNATESLQFSPPKKYWWVGFDCMHDSDIYPPPMSSKPRGKTKAVQLYGATYKTLEYVLAQLQSLAYQLSAYDKRLYFDKGIL